MVRHHHYHQLQKNISFPTADDGSRINRTTGSSPGDPTFDSSMFIVLAALICTSIFALGLTSAVRCCRQRLERELAASKGIKKEEISQIPAIVYKKSGDSSSNEETECCCPICLGEFRGGEKVRLLPRCSHAFHRKCIDTWLNSHSSCPICRQILFQHADEGLSNRVLIS